MQLHMALSIGSGRPWLGHKTERLPVLYINLELKENGLNNRVYDICEAMGLDPVSGHDVGGSYRSYRDSTTGKRTNDRTGRL
jgi:RecA-family ATPase